MIRTARRFRVSVLLAILALGLVPVDGEMAAAARPQRLVLGAENTFTASTISGLRVRIPAPASFEAGSDSSHIQIEGRGRMTGYVLVQEGRHILDRVTLMTTISRFCGEPGCNSKDPFFWHGGTKVPKDSETGVSTLPSGDYILYVVADGAPVTVTLRFDGLRGPAKRVALKDSVDAGIVLPRVRASVGPTRSVYSFGEEVDFSGPSGIAIPLMRFRTGHAFSNRREVCYYLGGPKVPDPVAYGPRCPAADAGVAIQELEHIEDHVVVDGYYSQASGPNRWGFGMNYVVGGEVREADSLFLYIDVDPREL